jgi:2-dehydro-3-deoxyglucarate aldolase
MMYDDISNTYVYAMNLNSTVESINPFRRRLLEKERLLGCWASLGSPITTEILGVAGFDWVLIDCEHAPNDVLSIVPQLMALKDSPGAAVVRPASNNATEIKRMLDLGCHNFLIPMVDTVAQAQAAVDATRYPPEGIRGVSVSQRSNRYGSIPNYFERINQQIGVAVQIETRAGVAAAAAIAVIEGVDALFVGPSDLAAAYGRLGNPGHPDVQAAIAEVRAAGVAAGKSIGILAPAELDAQRYLQQGFNFVAVGSDLGILRMQSQALLDRYRAKSAVAIPAQY